MKYRERAKYPVVTLGIQYRGNLFNIYQQIAMTELYALWCAFAATGEQDCGVTFGIYLCGENCLDQPCGKYSNHRVCAKLFHFSDTLLDVFHVAGIYLAQQAFQVDSPVFKFSDKYFRGINALHICAVHPRQNRFRAGRIIQVDNSLSTQPGCKIGYYSPATGW